MCRVPCGMKYSFSALSSFNTCPLAWKMHYIDRLPEEENYFAEYGTLTHSLLEDWAKGEIPDFALAEEWEERYDQIVHHAPPPFPKGMAQKSYLLGESYFQSFTGFGSEYDIASVEERFEVDVGGYTIVGLADLVLRHRETGEYLVIDHKTKSPKTMRKDFDEYVKQLYIYAMYVHQRFGQYPERMAFNLTKAPEEKFEEIFSEERLAEVKKWILTTIHRIEQEQDWLPGGSDYFCRNICGYRYDCPARVR